MGQEIDWAAVLADLEAKRATLDGVINSLRSLLGTGTLEAISTAIMKDGPARETSEPQEVKPGVFHGMSVSEACRKYLEITKTKQKTRAICDALLQGGIVSDAVDFYSNVYTTMVRNKDFLKLGKYWALAEWYPNRVPTAAARSGRKARRARKARKGRAPAAGKPKVVDIATDKAQTA